MIEFDKFNFAYKDKVTIYDDLNLKIVSGKIYGLFGKNGAGKSTLLKNLVGLNRPTNGHVIVNGSIPKKRLPSFLNNIFMVPEDIYIPQIKQSTFVKIYSSFYPRFSFNDLYDNLNKLDVPEGKKLNNLSFGQRKKFLIGFALACNTEVLVLDEPTNGLDIPSKDLFRSLIDSSINKHKLFIISTHQVRDLENILDHVLIVDKGNLVLNASIKEVRDKLSFKFYSETRPKNVILCQEVPGGYAVMERNRNNDQTNVNLEQLFSASLLKSKEIISIFNHQ